MEQIRHRGTENTEIFWNTDRQDGKDRILGKEWNYGDSENTEIIL